jgi:hypothetical protein
MEYASHSIGLCAKRRLGGGGDWRTRFFELGWVAVLGLHLAKLGTVHAIARVANSRGRARLRNRPE